MQTKDIRSRRFAILVDDGFERSELVTPMETLREAGAQVLVLTPNGSTVRSWEDGEWGDDVEADGSVADAVASDFDAVILPGGVMNPDSLRTNVHVQHFIRDVDALGRTVAAICHGPWSLIDAGVVEGRTVTSWPSVKTDLMNAGATWVDDEVVVDGHLITSRKPADLEAFCDAILKSASQPSVPNPARQPAAGLA